MVLLMRLSPSAHGADGAARRRAAGARAGDGRARTERIACVVCVRGRGGNEREG